MKIGRTVSSIVHSFFRNPSNILVYICDTSDKHQAARDRKFKIWFKQYASLDDLVFVSEVIDVEDDSYFASMILSRRTTDFYQIQTTFHDYFQDLRSKLDNHLTISMISIAGSVCLLPVIPVSRVAGFPSGCTSWAPKLSVWLKTLLRSVTTLCFPASGRE